ncbi:MAG: DUF1330 domain-containing protein [Bacteriovoracia bacterium]
MILVTQLLYLVAGKEREFDEFENMAIPLIQKYRGRLLLRIRPTQESVVDHGIPIPYEVHLIEFRTDEDFRLFLGDDDRKNYLHLKQQSVSEAVLIQGARL